MSPEFREGRGRGRSGRRNDSLGAWTCRQRPVAFSGSIRWGTRRARSGRGRARRPHVSGRREPRAARVAASQWRSTGAGPGVTCAYLFVRVILTCTYVAVWYTGKTCGKCMMRLVYRILLRVIAQFLHVFAALHEYGVPVSEVSFADQVNGIYCLLVVSNCSMTRFLFPSCSA